MTQQTLFTGPPGRIVRWRPPAKAGDDLPECRTAWRDNVVRRQDFEVAHPDVIWPPFQEPGAPWVAYVPMPDASFLEVADAAELGRLLDKLAIAVAWRDAQPQRAAQRPPATGRQSQTGER
jgi:hypothetical protein